MAGKENAIKALAAERAAKAARLFCEELQEDAEGVPQSQLVELNAALDAWEAYPDARESFDDTQPVQAALASLIEDGNATDHQRRVAHLALTAIQNHEDELDKELRRWQDAIRDKMIDLGAPDWKIDGAGCDSGDPLDFTLAEVGQGVGYFLDQLEELRGQFAPNGYWPTLIDRGDGVRGHYCIGRLIKPSESCWEFWNAGQWLSAGQVFVGRELAQTQLDKVRYDMIARSTRG